MCCPPLRVCFPQEEKVPKRIAEEKFFHSPRLRREWRLNGARRHILLIQRLTIGHANPTDPVTFGNSEVQTDPISFDNDKLSVTIGGHKAELSIKGQGLLHISDKRTGSNRIEGGLTHLGCCHGFLFLSAANTTCACEVILPNAPRSGTVLSLSRRFPEAGKRATPISLPIADDALTDVPCFNERLTCAAERLQAFCQENEIPGPSAPRVYHEYGDTLLVVPLEGA